MTGHAHVAGPAGARAGPWLAPPPSPGPTPVPPRPPPCVSVWDASRCAVAASGRWSCPTPCRRAAQPSPVWVHHADRVAVGQASGRTSRAPYTVFPCMPGVSDPAGAASTSPIQCRRYGLPRVRRASAPAQRPMAGLHTLPAPSPVNASRLLVPRATHDSGPVWLAGPALSEPCTPSHHADLSRHTPTLGLSLPNCGCPSGPRPAVRVNSWRFPFAGGGQSGCTTHRRVSWEWAGSNARCPLERGLRAVAVPQGA
jgi:hypothetical protein